MPSNLPKKQNGGSPMKKTKSKSKSKSKSQKGGASIKKTKTKSKSKSKSQKGGSPASTLVMEATTDIPVMNDYIASPRIRDSSDSKGCMAGGSDASDMVNKNLNANANTVSYPEMVNPTGDINSLNTYQLTGGLRKKKDNKKRKSRKNSMNKKNSKKDKNSKNNRNSKKNKSSKNKKRNHVMRGGYGSAWIASQYSLGNINGASMNSNAADFSASQGVSRDVLMNPPTLGLAGSGYPMSNLEGANVQSVGAPLV